MSAIGKVQRLHVIDRSRDRLKRDPALRALLKARLILESGLAKFVFRPTTYDMTNEGIA
jgi:hypothetical protein